MGDAYKTAIEPLLRAVAQIRRDIDQVYQDGGFLTFRMIWTPVMLYLADADHAPTISELAAAHGIQHASMSQRIANMAQEGLVVTVPGPDARERAVRLTPQGESVLALAREEWRASEATLAELDLELGGALLETGLKLFEALERRPFATRLKDHLQ